MESFSWLFSPSYGSRNRHVWIHYLGHETKVPVEDKELCYPIAVAQVQGQTYTAHVCECQNQFEHVSYFSYVSYRC